MAKRDPLKTQRNKKIKQLTEKINDILPEVLKATGVTNFKSLNSKFGGKHAEFIDIKNEVILSAEQFRALYFQGYLRKLESIDDDNKQNSNYYKSYKLVKNYPIVQEWLSLYLERTYLRKFDELSKVRPTVKESTMWIGQENASYGLLVTPRFRDGEWENDKSEIRCFKPKYWTVGHILQTGLVVPGVEEKIEFSSIEDYLMFFKNVLVRNSGSCHEKEIAQKYCDFIRSSENPIDVPLLIPEFRYGGIKKKACISSRFYCY